MSSEAAVAHETKSDDHARNVQDFEMWNPHPQGTWVMPEDDTPLTFEELKTRARQVHVDQVRDMVPFWMQGVRAAEKGEVLRMEDFLEKMAAEDRWGVNGVDDPWGPSIGPWPSDHPWGAAVPPIEADPWADIEKDPWGKVDQDPWGKMSGWGAEEDSTLSAHVDRSVSHRKGNHQRNKGGAKGKGKKGKVNGKTKPRDTFLFVEDIARQQAVDADRKQRMHEFFEVCSCYFEF